MNQDPRSDEAAAADLAALKLTVEERMKLWTTAIYQMTMQDDWRYWSADPEERPRIQSRWRQIANALHPDPWDNLRGKEHG